MEFRRSQLIVKLLGLCLLTGGVSTNLAAKMGFAPEADTSRNMLQYQSEQMSYAILLSLSEPVEIITPKKGLPTYEAWTTEQRRHRQARMAKNKPALPAFEASRDEPGTALAEQIQLATAHRLRGESELAADYYAKVVRASAQPIHLHFYAEVARTNGHDLLADYLNNLYDKAQNGKRPLLAQPKQAGVPVRIAAVIYDAQSGNCLADVTVQVLEKTALVEHSARTDRNGLFVIDGLRQNSGLLMMLTKAGYQSQMLEQDLSEEALGKGKLLGLRLFLQPENESAANF